jgi:condensin-2 complex subunit H2
MGPAKRSSQPFPSTKSSSQSSSPGYDDARFVELLKPIKDLTVNWSVPLAKYLEDYYEELTDLQINLDGRTTTVNFTEAALFLQGTASVYSKKVEYLWQNVLKMLDLLSSKKALEEASAADDEDDGVNDGTGKKRSKKSTFDGSKFSLVSIELARNTDLKNDEHSAKGSVHSRKMTLKFIFVTPRQLIEKESKEQKMTRINMYVKGGGKFELLGQKEEFRVNSQFAMGTGMIGEELSAESELGQQSVSLCEDSDLSQGERTVIEYDPFDQIVITDEAVPLAVEDAQDVVVGDFGMDDDFGGVDHDDDIGGVLNDNDNNNDDLGSNDMDKSGDQRKRRRLAEELLDEPKAPLADTWEPIKPHEVITIPKPIRKGRRKRDAAPDTSKLQKSATKSRGGKHVPEEGANGRTRVSVPIEEFLIQELRRGSSVNSLTECNLALPFREEAIQELKSRKNKIIVEIGDLQQATPDDQDQDNNEGWADFNPLDDINDDFMPDADDQLLAMVEPPPMDNEGNKDTYEELVMKRVAAYVAQSQDYIESTDLARRVRAWHESLGPKLVDVEKRGDFDIHAYGSRIISRFPKDKRKTTIEFGDVAEGSSHEEVARLFLSSLMLANAQNIDIQCSASKKEYLPMDQVSLTLLSTERHHEHMMESIPESQQEMEKKRKRPQKQPPLTTLEAIREEPNNHFDEEHQETLEAFDAITSTPITANNSSTISKKISNGPKNGQFAVPLPTSKKTAGKHQGGRKKATK